MGEIQRQTGLKILLGSAELAKQATSFFIITRLLSQFSYINSFLEEKDGFNVDIRGTEAESK